MNITASHRDAALFIDLSGNHIHNYVQGYRNIIDLSGNHIHNYVQGYSNIGYHARF